MPDSCMAVAKPMMIPFSGIFICRPAAMTALPLLIGPGPNCTPLAASTPWAAICCWHEGVARAVSVGVAAPANSTKITSSAVSANGASSAAAA